MSGCAELSTNQSSVSTEGKLDGKYSKMKVNREARERHSFNSRDRWVQRGKTQEWWQAMIHKKEPDVLTQSDCFIQILIARYRTLAVFFFLFCFFWKYDLCSPLYATMSMHISILTLPPSVLGGSNRSSIKPQPCRYKLSQIAGDQWTSSV